MTSFTSARGAPVIVASAMAAASTRRIFRISPSSLWPCLPQAFIGGRVESIPPQRVRQPALLAGCEKIVHGAQRNAVAIGAEAGDDRGSDEGHIRVVVIRLPFVNVGNVQFDDGPRKHLEGIEDRDRRERIGGRIDDDAAALVDCLMDPVDKLHLAVGLAKFDRMPGRFDAAHFLDFGPGGPTVDVRLANPETVQVGAVEDVDWLAHASPRHLLRSGTAAGPDRQSIANGKTSVGAGLIGTASFVRDWPRPSL